MNNLPRFLGRFALLLATVGVIPIARADDTDVVDPSRLEATVLTTGLVQPMELEVAADWTVFFIELGGKLRKFDPQTNEITLVGEVTITTEQENGLLGMALDPNFLENHWVFLQYSPPTYPGQHISRFTLIDGKLDLTTEKLLFKFEEQRKECCHHAGSLEFGPRGELFIATGDNTHPHADSNGYAPIDERPDRAPWDAQKSSANTRSGSGKILRIKPLADGTYEIPEGNLFPKDGSVGLPEIYVMGCRNPWRMTVDSVTGYVYWGEVGPDAGADGPRGPRGYDEINQARAAGNFGWPYFIANNQPYNDYNYTTMQVGASFNLRAPENDSPNNTGAKVLPPPQPAMIYYPYGESPEFPELGNAGGRSACAGPVYHYDESLASNVKFPAAYDQTLFFFEWTRHWIKAVHLDAEQKVKQIEAFMPTHRFVRPIDMQFGPEGALYAIEYGETWGVNADSRLIRIDYIRGNRPPLVVASTTNNIGKQPLAVSLSSQGTSDKDTADVLKYEWRVIRSSDVEKTPRIVSTEANPLVTFDEPGVYNVELVVTDAAGASRAASVPVLVGNARPTLNFLEPQAGDFFDAQQPIRYRLYVNDPEDGTNDSDEADAKGLPDLDVDSPMRVSLSAAFSAGPIPPADGAATEEAGPRGLQLMRKSDCFNCHAVNQKRVGPPYLDVANKYRGIEGALDASIQRVLKGSTGVWGKIPMIPHSQHTPEELREMVSWVYQLQPSGLVRIFPGFVGEIPVAAEDTAKPGHYTLEANYVDRGAGEVPALNATAVVHLRPRLVEAETADEIHGPMVLGSGTAGGEKFVGAINHDHYVKFTGIKLNAVGHITVRVASAGSGGAIEIRRDAIKGELLASVPIEVNGQWEQWYDRTVEIPETQGRHDLFFRFVNDQSPGGLMNLDSVYFQP